MAARHVSEHLRPDVRAITGSVAWT
jgi:hypothetical protein